jgi:Dolichyl-phosphate-mannose-protein mannosyltransferase
MPTTAAVGVRATSTTSGIVSRWLPFNPPRKLRAMVAVPARAQVRLRQLSLSRWHVAIAVVAVAGVVARVWIYRSILDVPSADEGLVGLWAIHATHGDFTTFFWGLHYGGTQEALLSVPLFLVFGPSWIALRIVPLLLSAAAALLVWRVGRRTIGERAGLTAGAIFWIWPPYVLLTTTRAGFYASNVFYCALVMLLGLRIVERPSRMRVGVFGLVLGLAYWQTSQIVPIAAPVIAWTIWKAPRALRHIWIAAPLAIVGALPWLVWNVRHSFSSLDLLSYDVHSTYSHRLRIFLSPLLPMITGLRTPFTQTLTLPAPLTYLIYALLVALFVYGFARTRRTNASMLYVIAVVFPFLYALSAWTVESSDPRYLIVFTPVLTLLIAQLGTRFLPAAALVLAMGALSFAVLHTMHRNVVEGLNPALGAPNDFRPLIKTLDRLGVRYVYSTHWVAYRLAFETDERIIGVKNDFTNVSFSHGQAQPALNPFFIRYPPYERAVRQHRHAFVFYSGLLDSIPIVKPLERYGYKPHRVGGLVVYTLPRGR